MPCLETGSRLAAAEIAPVRDEQEERIMAEVMRYRVCTHFVRNRWQQYLIFMEERHNGHLAQDYYFE